MVDYTGGMAAQIEFEVTKGRAKVCIGFQSLEMLKRLRHHAPEKELINKQRNLPPRRAASRGTDSFMSP